MRILYVEDDPFQREIAAQWLQEQSHDVIACANGDEAIRAIERDSFDIAILDWMMPHVSGEEVLRWLRARRHGMPVMFATANDDESEIVHILKLGADDYLVKPLRRLEFLARVEALGRRVARTDGVASSDIEAAPYRLVAGGRTVLLEGRPVAMTPRMAAIATLLFRKRGEIVSRDQIYAEVWGHRQRLETRSVDTHVSRLRAALELDGRHGWRLASVYQHGYRLERTS